MNLGKQQYGSLEDVRLMTILMSPLPIPKWMCGHSGWTSKGPLLNVTYIQHTCGTGTRMDLCLLVFASASSSSPLSCWTSSPSTFLSSSNSLSPTSYLTCSNVWLMSSVIRNMHMGAVSIFHPFLFWGRVEWYPWPHSFCRRLGFPSQLKEARRGNSENERF